MITENLQKLFDFINMEIYYIEYSVIPFIKNDVIPYIINSFYEKPIESIEAVIIILAIITPTPKKLGFKYGVGLFILIFILFGYEIGIMILVARFIFFILKAILTSLFGGGSTYQG